MTIETMAPVQLIEQSMERAGADVWVADSDALPAVIANHPRCGLVAIDIAEDDGAMVALNRKVSTLRAAVTNLARVPVLRHVVHRDRLADVADERWMDDLPDREYEPKISIALGEYFGPRISIDVPSSTPARRGGNTSSSGPNSTRR